MPDRLSREEFDQMLSHVHQVFEEVKLLKAELISAKEEISRLNSKVKRLEGELASAKKRSQGQR